MTRWGCERSPDDLNRIMLEPWVRSDHWQILLQTLGDQHSVEGIAMMHGEPLESEQMINADRESFDPVLRQSTEQIGGGRPREIQLARLYLDENFPEAGNAEEKIAASGKNVAGMTRHPLIPGQRPQECVRVEDRFHSGTRGPL